MQDDDDPKPPSRVLNKQAQRSADLYNLAASGYDKPAGRFAVECARRLVEIADLQPRGRVLDVGTGTGAAAFAAAARLGPNGRVLGVDVAEDMLAQARASIARKGITTIELRMEDAQALSCPDATFDAVLCASAIYCMDDMRASLREWRRVLRPGGVVVFQGYSEGAFQPLSDLFEECIRRNGLPLPQRERPFPWQRLTTLDACRDLLRESGFERIAVHVEQVGYYLNTTEEWWDIVWNSGYREPLTRLSPKALARFKAEHLAEVAGLTTNEGIWLDVSAIFASGRKPEAVGEDLEGA